MKLQKQLSKKRGDKVYHKYVINIPEEIIKKAQLKKGDELEVEAEQGRIVLKKKAVGGPNQ